MIKFILFSLIGPLALAKGFTADTPPARPAAQKTVRTEPPLHKGWWITVLKLDRKKRLLVIQIDKTPDVGPNLARPEDLINSVDIVDPDERRTFLNDPSRFVGSKFVLEKDLPLVSP